MPKSKATLVARSGSANMKEGERNRQVDLFEYGPTFLSHFLVIFMQRYLGDVEYGYLKDTGMETP